MFINCGAGFADLLVSGVVSCFNATTRNNAFVFLGGADGLSTVPVTLSAPGAAQSHIGVASNVGDVNGDGYGDGSPRVWQVRCRRRASGIGLRRR